MYVLLVMLIFQNGPELQYRSPNMSPLFFSAEQCETFAGDMAEAIKQKTGAKNVVYTCTQAVPVNAPGA